MKLPVSAFLLCLPLNLLAASSMSFPVDDSVVSVARNSLQAYLSLVPPGQEARYGFHDRAEFARAKLGVPIAVYTTRPALTDSLPDRVDSSWNRPLAIGRWRVPVEVDGQSRVFLTVESVDGTLRTVDFGGAALAREIGDFGARHSGKKALLRLDRLQCDVLVVDRTGAGIDEGDYYPLKSARSALAADSGTFRSRQRMFETIHHLARQDRGARP